jgi:hypothetical protein
MEHFASLAGLAGAALCVATYAAVSVGCIKAETPLFFLFQGAGALLVLAGASHTFDNGDLGTIAQELTWALVSAVGVARAVMKTKEAEHAASAE